jgi:formylglycine-generating enzyme required for sulfatase activity
VHRLGPQQPPRPHSGLRRAQVSGEDAAALRGAIQRGDANEIFKITQRIMGSTPQPSKSSIKDPQLLGEQIKDLGQRTQAAKKVVIKEFIDLGKATHKANVEDAKKFIQQYKQTETTRPSQGDRGLPRQLARTVSPPPPPPTGGGGGKPPPPEPPAPPPSREEPAPSQPQRGGPAPEQPQLGDMIPGGEAEPGGRPGPPTESPQPALEGEQPTNLTPPPQRAGGGLPTQPQASPQPQQTGPTVSDAQRGQMLDQVLTAALLLGSSNRAGSSVAETSAFLRQTAVLNYGFVELAKQMQQMTDGGRTLTPEQKAAMTAVLNALSKQFEVLRNQAGQILGAPVPPEEAAQGDPLKAALALKAKTDALLNQVQGRLDAKVAELGQQIALKGSLAAALAAAKAKEEAGAQAATAIAAKDETASKPQATAAPGAPGAEATAAEAKPAARSPMQIPSIIQSHSDLHGLAKQLEKRELSAPLNVALAYPLGKKEDSQNLQGAKAEAGKEKKDQSAASFGEGGGHVLAMVLVPKGPALIEGPFLNPQVVELESFLISAFPITNEQFADWLNEALAAQKIKLDDKRVVIDPTSREVICKTQLSSPTSQIELEVAGNELVFKPVKGTERHPIVRVSWLGAAVFCKDNGFRLPTEAEWEKAAGAPILGPGEPLRKFQYGFGQDEISPSFANFRNELREYDDNRTSPVGFYNGETLFTKQGKNYQSRYACSPFGCYDMSGNVREWTSDAEKAQKITKGGSYNSPPEELLTSARALFSPTSCNSDTGFRVVIDLN